MYYYVSPCGVLRYSLSLSIRNSCFPMFYLTPHENGPLPVVQIFVKIPLFALVHVPHSSENSPIISWGNTHFVFYHALPQCTWMHGTMCIVLWWHLFRMPPKYSHIWQLLMNLLYSTSQCTYHVLRSAAKIAAGAFFMCYQDILECMNCLSTVRLNVWKCVF